MAHKPAPPQKTYPPKTQAPRDEQRITRPHGAAPRVTRGAEDSMRKSFGLKPRGKC